MMNDNSIDDGRMIPVTLEHMLVYLQQEHHAGWNFNCATVRQQDSIAHIVRNCMIMGHNLGHNVAGCNDDEDRFLGIRDGYQCKIPGTTLFAD